MATDIFEIADESEIVKEADGAGLKNGDKRIYVLPSGEYIERVAGVIETRASIQWLKEKKKNLAENIAVLQAERAAIQAMIDALPKKENVEKPNEIG